MPAIFNLEFSKLYHNNRKFLVLLLAIQQNYIIYWVILFIRPGSSKPADDGP